MPGEFGFELPRINPLVDEDLRRKLLGDVPTLEDMVPIQFGLLGSGNLFGGSRVVEEKETREREEVEEEEG